MTRPKRNGKSRLPQRMHMLDAGLSLWLSSASAAERLSAFRTEHGMNVSVCVCVCVSVAYLSIRVRSSVQCRLGFHRESRKAHIPESSSCAWFPPFAEKAQMFTATISFFTAKVSFQHGCKHSQGKSPFGRGMSPFRWGKSCPKSVKGNSAWKHQKVLSVCKGSFSRKTD